MWKIKASIPRNHLAAGHEGERRGKAQEHAAELAWKPTEERVSGVG